MADCNAAARAGYFLAGVGIGIVVALLFAPRSGRETRKFIAGKAGQGKDYVASKRRDLRKQAEELIDKGKGVVSKQKERLADALEAGKEAARTTFAR
jgi:gas vesicle protein